MTIKRIEQFELELKSDVFSDRRVFDDAYILVVIRIETHHAFNAGHSSQLVGSPVSRAIWIDKCAIHRIARGVQIEEAVQVRIRSRSWQR